jgi:MFS family permease
MSSQSNAERKSIRAQLRKVVAASMAGTVVEWYEFFLYGSAATLVFNHILFPPSDNPLTPILAGFATYAVGFIARPVGGIVFGHFGDKVRSQEAAADLDHPRRCGHIPHGLPADL